MTGNSFGIALDEVIEAGQRVLWHCATRSPASQRNGRSAGRAMTIGQLADRTGITVKALRRYEGMGLVYSLGRSSSGYRLFDEAALGCVYSIQSLRGLGLTEAQIAQLADQYATNPGEPVGSQLAHMLQRARDRITVRIDALDQIRQRIDQYRSAHAGFLDSRNDQAESCTAGGPNACWPGLDPAPAGRQ